MAGLHQTERHSAELGSPVTWSEIWGCGRDNEWHRVRNLSTRCLMLFKTAANLFIFLGAVMVLGFVFKTQRYRL